jgi:hypothetical protein
MNHSFVFVIFFLTVRKIVIRKKLTKLERTSFLEPKLKLKTLRQKVYAGPYAMAA